MRGQLRNQSVGQDMDLRLPRTLFLSVVLSLVAKQLVYEFDKFCTMNHAAQSFQFLALSKNTIPDLLDLITERGLERVIKMS